MKRRGFLGLMAGAPFFATSVASAQEAVSATPIAGIDAGRAALLVMDYQPAWISTLTDSDPLLERAAQAIAVARERGVRVAYCRVAFTPADDAAVPDGNIIFTQLVQRPGGLNDGAPDLDIDRRVAPEPGEKVIRKTRVGAFTRTDLDGWLRGLGIDTLILAGISTSGVVLSTVCDAADRDYRLYVLADACADRDPEIQNTLTGNVFPQRAQVITVADLPELLG